MRLFPCLAALGLLVVVAAVIGGMLRARTWALKEVGSPQAQADWDTWRRDVERQQQEGNSPVKRRVPKSPEPNLLVLMRDHFPMSLAVVVVFCSLLYLVFVFLLRGAFFPSGPSEARMEP